MKCANIIQIGDGDPLVLLPNGLIRGHEAVTIENKTYYTFQKIPYATPPTGDLRFKAPQPAQNWDGILDTTNIDVSCYQTSSNPSTESEDCLFINIFTPKLPSEDPKVSFPVLFYIHGGGFIDGSSPSFQTDLFINNDIVVASINYRVGVFGFLSTQDEVVPGNNGLKDQLLALQWAHDNIKLFGGDPEKITIYGQSAGSASCAYHLLNQQSL
ncbi:COesterase and/or Abhydrolase 3 domain containing protein, partial [Asbolus verrucosus]